MEKYVNLHIKVYDDAFHPKERGIHENEIYFETKKARRMLLIYVTLKSGKVCRIGPKNMTVPNIVDLAAEMTVNNDISF